MPEHDPGHPRRPDRPGGHHARPAAAVARGAGAHRLGALHRPPAAAVHGQPPSESAFGRRLGRLTRRGTSRLYTMATSDQLSGQPSALARRARAGRRRPRGRARITAACRPCWPAPVAVAGVLLVRRRPVGSPARGALRRDVSPAGARRAAGSDVDGRRSRLRHGPDVRRDRAVRRPQVIAVDNSAAMLAAARRRLGRESQRRVPPRRSRGVAASPMASSMRRR